MNAQFTVNYHEVVRFDVQEDPPLRTSHIHNCCPFGWGTIYELQFDRQVDEIAIYRIVSQRSEKP